MWKKGKIFALLVEMQIDIATIENSMEVPQKIKNRKTIQSSNLKSGIYPEKHKLSKIYTPRYSLQCYFQ